MTVFGLFRIRLVNYTHSGPNVKNKWVLLFALLFFFDLMISDLRTLNYNKKNGQSCTIAVASPRIGSNVAANAPYRKIQAVRQKVLVGLLSHSEHLLLEKM